MITLETERLLLRALKDSDYTDIFEYASNSDVTSMVGMRLHETDEMSKKYITHERNKNETFGIVHKEDNKLIGTISLRHTEPHSRLVSIVINPSYWGKGYGPEAIKEVIRYAFSNLPITHIYGGYYSFNQQSKRVHEKLGFTYVKTTKNNYEYKGELYDSIDYILTRKDYEVGK